MSRGSSPARVSHSNRGTATAGTADTGTGSRAGSGCGPATGNCGLHQARAAALCAVMLLPSTWRHRHSPCPAVFLERFVVGRGHGRGPAVAQAPVMGAWRVEWRAPASSWTFQEHCWGSPGQVAIAALGFPAKSVLTGCPIKILADLGKAKHSLTLCYGLSIPSTCLENPSPCATVPPAATSRD